MIKFTSTKRKDYWLTFSQIEDMVQPDTIILDGCETGIIIDKNITLWINPATQQVHIEEVFINEDNEKDIFYPEIEYMTQEEVQKLLDFEETCYLYRKKIST